ncbi:DUF5677 domain-containing protein [Terriglobus roseus]|uniref:Uncharacterized protein n=1 Tax=Terriglobus roseus TaxID=392734 RepID=A0A1H4J480_9BACT|nr:DUF5677 domain-containing protein [Terriglobus roseus]SEB40776.1 hypothetical protein SAMN05443244_0331 [Terriglobus roseus]
MSDLELEMSTMKRLDQVLVDIVKMIKNKVGNGVLTRLDTITILHILRARSMVKSMKALVELGAIPDFWTLSRSLTELVINCDYLQHAPAQELERYLSFDFQKFAKQANDLNENEFAPRKLSNSNKDWLAKTAADAEAITGRTEKQPTWSQHPLPQRAKEADKHYAIAAHQSLLLSSVPFGHAGTHATMTSLAFHIDELQGLRDDALHAMTPQHVHVAVLAMSLLCHSISEVYNLQLSPIVLAICKEGVSRPGQ